MVDRNPLYDFGNEGEGEAPTFNERWGSLPVEAPRFNLTPNVALVESTPKPLKQGTDPVTGRPDLKFVPVDDPWANTPKPIKKLLGVGGEERYQLWPERALRSGLSAPLDALTGRMQVNDPETGMPTDEAIRRSQDVASVGGPGGLMNLEEKGVLGSHGGNLVQREFNNKIQKVESDPNYVYHATNVERANDIAEGGKLNTHKPHEFTDQEVWPDGKTEKRNYFTSDAKNTWQFAPEEGKPVLLRVKKEDHPFKREITGDIYSTKPVDASKIEYLNSNNQWTTLKSDTSKPGMAMAAINSQRAAPFYSAVEHAVSNIKQDKMPADQWLGTLSNSKGVKPEELDWTGLKDHLAEKGKEPVTKQEVQDYVNTNKVELKEINKGKYTEEQNARYQQLLNKKDRTSDEKTELKELIKNVEPPKFSQYQLPGGENYKEMLMTLPIDPKIKALEIAKREGYNSLEEVPIRERQEFLEDAKSAGYKSSHWDEPNVLAHVRTNDRNITAPGETTPKKSLHIEEIQSDWHQAGRQYGYKDGEPLTTRKQENSPHGNNVYEAVDHSGTVVGRGFSPDEALQAAKSMPSVPDAPFKKTWHELALKRMIREAAEKGYDRLSWTPGEAQALRYPEALRQAVDNISWSQPQEGGMKYVHAKPKGGGMNLVFEVNPEGKIINSSASSKAIGKPITDVIGKEMAANELLKSTKEGDIDSKNFVSRWRRYERFL